MKQRIKILLLFCFLSCLVKTMTGANQKFRASMMIAESSPATVQGQYGHAFIRLQYPAERLDYCFTLETTNDDEHAWDIITGNYTTSVMAFPSSQYMSQFRNQQRSVVELPLNLTDKEIQTLWRTLDETIVDTMQVIPPDYFTHGCSAELTDILFRCIDGYVEFSPVVCDSLGDSYFQVGDTYRPLSSWSIIGLGFCFASGMFEKRLPENLLYVPLSLPFMFSHAEIVNDGKRRPLLSTTRAKAYNPTGKQTLIDATPVHIFPVDTAMPVRMYALMLLSLQLLLAFFAGKSVRCINVLLFIVYNLMTFAILLVNVLTSMTELQGWNWMLFFYNPLPLLLWVVNRKRPMSPALQRKIHATLTIWAVVCVAVMAIFNDTVLIGNTLFSAIFALQLVISMLKNRTKKPQNN